MRRIVVLSDEEMEKLANNDSVVFELIGLTDKKIVLCNEKCFEEMRSKCFRKFKEVE